MEPLIRAGALQGYKALMKELGVDPLPVVKQFGIPPEALDNSDALISLPRAMGLLEESAIATSCPYFGLRLASHQNPEAIGILSVVLLTAANVVQAAEDASRYLFLHSPAMEFVIERPSPLFSGCTAFRLAFRQQTYIPHRQSIDAAIGYAWQILRLVTGGKAELEGVALPHSPIARKNFYDEYFDATVLFEQPYASLHVRHNVETMSLEPVNPMLRSIALDYIAKNAAPDSQNWTESVRRAITRTLGANRGSKPEIASLLGIHPRTLQRRLEEEGSSFESIREEVFRSAVMGYLQETNISLGQLADILGYAGQAALTRSCKRWFGKTPSELRKLYTSKS